MNGFPAQRSTRLLLAIPLVVVWLLGTSLATSGGGFGGSSPSTTSSSSSSGSTSSSSSFGSSSSIWGPSSSSTSSGSSSPGSSWTLGEVLFVMGLLVAYVLITSLIDWWKARRLAPSVVQVQVLFADGAEVKEQLQKLARTHDPDRPGALLTLLRESALLLLRHRADWAYGTLERRRVGDLSRAANVVGTWAARARAAFETQTTSQYQNGNAGSGLVRDRDYQGKRGGTYLAVTLAASTVGVTYPDPPDSREDLEETLLALSGVEADHLGRLEVVWSPDAEGEFLGEDEAIRRYPTLTRL